MMWKKCGRVTDTGGSRIKPIIKLPALIAARQIIHRRASDIRTGTRHRDRWRLPSLERPRGATETAITVFVVAGPGSFLVANCLAGSAEDVEVPEEMSQRRCRRGDVGEEMSQRRWQRRCRGGDVAEEMSRRRCRAGDVAVQYRGGMSSRGDTEVVAEKIS
jgi:hypothetical protein